MRHHKDYDYFMLESTYPFWPMFFIWLTLGAIGAVFAFIKALPAILLALMAAAPILTICLCVLMMVGTAMILAIRNNEPRYWFLPIFPVLLLWAGGRALLVSIFAFSLTRDKTEILSTANRKKLRG